MKPVSNNSIILTGRINADKSQRRLIFRVIEVTDTASFMPAQIQSKWKILSNTQQMELIEPLTIPEEYSKYNDILRYAEKK